MRTGVAGKRNPTLCVKCDLLREMRRSCLGERSAMLGDVKVSCALDLAVGVVVETKGCTSAPALFFRVSLPEAIKHATADFLIGT